MGSEVKVISCILLLLSLLLPLPAADFSLSLSAGARIDQHPSDAFIYALGAEYENIGLSFQHQIDGGLDVALSYKLESGNMNHLFSLSNDYIPREGGWSGALYLFSQDFRFGYFALGYGVGIQGAITYSDHTSHIGFSLAPLMHLYAGFASDYLSILAYASLSHPYDRTWRFKPYFGAIAEVLITDGHSLFADAYIACSEMLMDPVWTPYIWSIRAGYIYRGK